MTRPHRRTSIQRRGQMVITMAVVVTIALVPVAAAYLQLGYASNTRPIATGMEPDDTIRALSQTVDAAAAEVAGEYEWNDRAEAVETVRIHMDPRIDRIEATQDASTTALNVTYNRSRAAHIASTDCPSGPGRAFGSCESHEGVVVQERAGETVIIAVALDIHTVDPDGELHVTHRFDA